MVPTRQRKEKVLCPQLVLQYDKGMGGVDLADMLIFLYRIPFKTKQWYLKVFFHCLDIGTVSAWILYRCHCDEIGIAKKQRIALLGFSVDVADLLISANKVAITSPTPACPGRPEKRMSNEGNDKPAKAGRKANNPLPNDDLHFHQIIIGQSLKRKKKRDNAAVIAKTDFSGLLQQM